MSEKYMELVFRTVRLGIQQGQSPFAACIVKDGEILSYTNNTVFQSSDILAHAEINAIKSAAQKLGKMKLEGASIYCSCEPCPMCFTACHWAGISSIFYSTRISDAKAFGFNELLISNEIMISLSNSNIILHKDILRNEGLKLFKEWKLFQRVYGGGKRKNIQLLPIRHMGN